VVNRYAAQSGDCGGGFRAGEEGPAPDETRDDRDLDGLHAATMIARYDDRVRQPIQQVEGRLAAVREPCLVDEACFGVDEPRTKAVRPVDGPTRSAVRRGRSRWAKREYAGVVMLKRWRGSSRFPLPCPRAGEKEEISDESQPRTETFRLRAPMEPFIHEKTARRRYFLDAIAPVNPNPHPWQGRFPRLLPREGHYALALLGKSVDPKGNDVTRLQERIAILDAQGHA
jgi:hypothetical protein